MSTLVIFGGAGDLAGRLLFPALVRLEGRGLLGDIRIVGYGLEDYDDAQFAEHVKSKVDAEPHIWTGFSRRLSYRVGGLGVEAVSSLMADMSDDHNVFYLALPPGLFPVAATAISESGLAALGRPRLVVEKPFGTDRSTAADLNRTLHEHWSEQQIFRIDHFLGKETVQNLSVMRFANRVLEPLLCAAHVDHVQITVAETLGVEGRYRYYDGIGALRDMIQNHLMQLFCLAAMEPPPVWEPEVLRDHKVEVLRSVRSPDAAVDTWAARGRYGPGTIDGRPVTGYLEESGIETGSTTETFAAVRLHVDNWRWQGVPFYLRSGKRLATPVSEIAYRFREAPTQLFHHTPLADPKPNWLVFRLNPPEGIDLHLQTKTPGLEMSATASRLHADYGSITETTTAYEQLLLDVIDGDHTPFLRVDEVDEAWRLLDPVLDSWDSTTPPTYASGSDGPADQHSIMLDGQTWRPLSSTPA